MAPGRRRIIGSVGARAGRITAGRRGVPRIDRYAQTVLSPFPEVPVSSLSGKPFVSGSGSSAAVTAILKQRVIRKDYLPAPAGWIGRIIAVAARSHTDRGRGCRAGPGCRTDVCRRGCCLKQRFALPEPLAAPTAGPETVPAPEEGGDGAATVSHRADGDRRAGAGAKVCRRGADRRRRSQDHRRQQSQNQSQNQSQETRPGWRHCPHRKLAPKNAPRARSKPWVTSIINTSAPEPGATSEPAAPITREDELPTSALAT